MNKNYLTLEKNATIGIFSPSLPAGIYPKKRFEKAKFVLELKGFFVKEGILTNQQDFYRSGSAQKRAQEFNELLYDKEVSCIMAIIGGMNTNSILPYIDYDYLKKHPKMIIGYSDVCALLWAIYQKTGIHCVYGATFLPTWGEISPFVDFSWLYFEELFINPVKFPLTIDLPEIYSNEYVNWEENYSRKMIKNDWKCVKKGKVQGRLLAGNMQTIIGILGTTYMPSINENDILLLEDTMVNPMIVEKGFAQLKLMGIFDKIGGIILGKYELYDDFKSKRMPEDILLEFIDRDIPILADFDCGHTQPMISMIIGSEVYLDSEQKIIKIIEK